MLRAKPEPLYNSRQPPGRIKNMPTDNANFFKNIPAQLPDELFETILKRDNLRIERIVSKGHVTPPGQWYDQDWDEWVMLLQGEATVLYQKDGLAIQLVAGDYLLIPAHTRHRVEWTPPDSDTVWLAVHLN